MISQATGSTLMKTQLTSTDDDFYKELIKFMISNVQLSPMKLSG